MLKHAFLLIEKILEILEILEIFDDSYDTTDSNQQCHIIDSTALESNYRCLDGYIVDNGVLYNLHIAYQEENSEQAIEMLHFWTDLF